jgi:hypothetical protein
MQSFLDSVWARERTKFPRCRHWLDVLISDGAEQTIIQDWCKNVRIPRAFDGRSIFEDIYNTIVEIGRDWPGVTPCENWEARLMFLAFCFADFIELTEWEAVPSKERSKRMGRVAKLARDLASALEETPRPYYPPALELFDKERAVALSGICQSRPQRRS